MKNRNIIESFKCAFRGIWYVLKSEKNCVFYILNMIVFGVINYFICSSVLNWVIYFLGFTGVMACECINTAIERLCDFLTDKIDDRIKAIKDMAAGSVLCFGIAFYINELFIIGMYLC